MAVGYSLGSLVIDLAKPQNYVSEPNLMYLAAGAAVATMIPLAEMQGSTLLAVALVIIARNLVICYTVYSTWHYLLYQRVPPISDKKLNPARPPPTQWRRDQLLTLQGAVIGSLFEIFVTKMTKFSSVGTGYSVTSFVWTTVTFVLAAAVSDVHFYFAHRVLHPWNTSFDPGALLFKHVHSVHHRSPNPGPWSGLAMHYIEHVIYFTRNLLPLVVSIPYPVFLFMVIRSIVGPAPGHHGYEDKLGSRFHFLHHHSKAHCNFGTRGYIDRYVGTFKA